MKKHMLDTDGESEEEREGNEEERGSMWGPMDVYGDECEEKGIYVKPGANPETGNVGDAGEYGSYTDGVVPLDSLPAAWWNWMWHQITRRLSNLWMDVAQVWDEIRKVLEAANVDFTGDMLNNDELFEAISNIISDKIATETTPGSVRSSDEWGNVSVDETGVMSVNGAGDPNEFDGNIITVAEDLGQTYSDGDGEHPTIVGAINAVQVNLTNFEGETDEKIADLEKTVNEEITKELGELEQEVDENKADNYHYYEDEEVEVEDEEGNITTEVQTVYKSAKDDHSKALGALNRFGHIAVWDGELNELSQTYENLQDPMSWTISAATAVRLYSLILSGTGGSGVGNMLGTCFTTAGKDRFLIYDFKNESRRGLRVCKDTYIMLKMKDENGIEQERRWYGTSVDQTIDADLLMSNAIEARWNYITVDAQAAYDKTYAEVYEEDIEAGMNVYEAAADASNKALDAYNEVVDSYGTEEEVKRRNGVDWYLYLVPDMSYVAPDEDEPDPDETEPGPEEGGDGDDGNDEPDDGDGNGDDGDDEPDPTKVRTLTLDNGRVIKYFKTDSGIKLLDDEEDEDDTPDYTVYASEGLRWCISKRSDCPVDIDTRFTENMSRKVGQFHTLCADAGNYDASDYTGDNTGVQGSGTISGSLYARYPAWKESTLQAGDRMPVMKYPANDVDGFFDFYNLEVMSKTDGTYYDVVDCRHPLDGFMAGDILPESVWCISFTPSCSPEGMVYDVFSDIAVDIYIQSGYGAQTKSVYNGTVVVSQAQPCFANDQHAVGKQLLSDDEYYSAALGSNEQTVYYGRALPGTTGGHVDTAGRRMLSSIGLEDANGVYWQALRDLLGGGNVYNGTTYGWNALDNQGSFGQNYGVNFAYYGGGNYADASSSYHVYSGSRSRGAHYLRSGTYTNGSARGSCALRRGVYWNYD